MVTAAICAAACAAAQPARAQLYVGRAVPHLGSVEVSGGVAWNQSFDLGSATAQLTRNPGTGTGLFDLFTSATSVGSGVGVQGRVGVYLTRALSVEGGIQYLRPTLSTTLSDDAEQASDAVATETLARYIFDGGVLYHFGSGGNRKMVPFVAVGGGYIRELHDGYGVVETGNEFHAAVGIKYWFSGGKRRLGLRADVGGMSRSGGVDFKDTRRTLATGSAGLSYLF